MRLLLIAAPTREGAHFKLVCIGRASPLAPG
jgi:hypothetical protein